jgi:hypothetical protein
MVGPVTFSGKGSLIRSLIISAFHKILSGDYTEDEERSMGEIRAYRILVAKSSEKSEPT